MRKALIVGIDYYDNAKALSGCVTDAYAVRSVLERHMDGTKNFDVKLLVGTGINDRVTRAELRSAVRELFASDGEASLLYFAGHGHVESVGGYLVTSDSQSGDEGLSLSEIIQFAHDSSATNKIIILDSCHSGAAADRPGPHALAELSEGMTILTASTKEQYAGESASGGVFTNLLVDALNGAAGNLVGEVTPGGVYAHVDQSLGSWGQRPVFKTNVRKFVFLRRVQPPISLADLQKLPEIFPASGEELALDPSFEPDSGVADPVRAEIFAVLQRYAKVNLVVPIGEAHMYYAAMNSKSCKLTVLGEHYRRLVVDKRI